MARLELYLLSVPVLFLAWVESTRTSAVCSDIPLHLPEQVSSLSRVKSKKFPFWTARRLIMIVDLFHQIFPHYKRPNLLLSESKHYTS
ncbi:hypothetical protein O6H91_01G149000 [Diphasiastrum complanatum]|uniref:Uncharacterized protein n=1 Tax=Diphasiastrum complanatum TaxID=34168 RepID=A0ACC2EX23_DIPCM|nr:hypothetical protein O6H91_01G149000 [Diphasiastrum complanatum]